MKKTAASFMLTGSLIWLIGTIWGLIEIFNGFFNGFDLEYMPANVVLLIITLIIIPTCFLLASIFFLFDNN